MAVISLSDVELSLPTALNTTYVTGVALTNGELVYSNANNSNKLEKGLSTSTSTSNIVGVVMIDASSGLSTAIATNNATIKKAGAFSKGAVYYLADVAGDICLESDLGSGEYVTQIGYATSTDELVILISKTGVQI
jgi:hypothetical protein